MLLLHSALARGLVGAACGLQRTLEGQREDEKSIGKEHTFPETASWPELDSIIMQLCKDVCLRLLRHGRTPSRIRVKCRFADWTDTCHVFDLPYRTQAMDVIYEGARVEIQKLFEAKRQASKNKLVLAGLGENKRDCPAYAVRLIGVSGLGWESDADSKQNVTPLLSKYDLESSVQNVTSSVKAASTETPLATGVFSSPVSV